MDKLSKSTRFVFYTAFRKGRKMHVFSKLAGAFLREVERFRAGLIICLIVPLLAACGSTGGASNAAPTTTLVPTSVPSATISPDCALGSHSYELSVAGESRSYILHVPPVHMRQEPTALVLGFHGNNGYANHFEEYSGFSSLADRAGFIVAYPQGAGEHPSWEAWHGGKDVQFVNDLIDKLIMACKIDPTQVYATGHSLGGGMANRLACDLAERIAAIGPVSGAYQDIMHCSPSQPVAVVSMHGTGDAVIFYNGFGVNGSSPQVYFAVGTPIPQWASAWAERNGCGLKASTFFQEDPVSGQRWNGCRAGADVILYTIRDGDHGWPSPDAGFDVAQTIWDFFRQHSRAQVGGSY
jgi:polyhydroxybutyrate depolymerase